MDTPIENPIPSSEVPSSGEESPVIVISRVLLNYIVIAVVCMLVGVVVGMIAQDRLTQGNLAQTQALIDRSVASAIAALPKDTTALADPNVRKDVSIDNRPSLGPHDAPVVIVEFADFHCTYCKRFHDETITPLLQNYGNQVLYVFRDYPILGPDSTQAALAAECAYDQDAFWNFHDRLFSDPTELTRPLFIKYAQDLKLDMDRFTSCYDNATHQTEISKDYNDATALGVGATPTFFINGKMLLGAQPYAAFAAAIDAELASAANDASKNIS
ncbi:MAG: thioredoxin domain-containing protein [Chloroflexota bacterium]